MSAETIARLIGRLAAQGADTDTLAPILWQAHDHGLRLGADAFSAHAVTVTVLLAYAIEADGALSELGEQLRHAAELLASDALDAVADAPGAP